jgi:hypothetical protein
MTSRHSILGASLALLTAAALIVGPVGATGMSPPTHTEGTADDSHTAIAAATATAMETETVQTDETQPETASEFLRAFQSIQGEQTLETYSELSVVRSQATVEVQTGEFSEAERRRMQAVLEALRSFVDAQQHVDDGSLTDALDTANATQASIDRLQGLEGGGRYSALLGVALDRFYEQIGSQFRDTAESASSTPAQVEALTIAATAYRRAGESRLFSRLSVRRDRIRAEYRTDLSRLTVAADDAESFTATCDESCLAPQAAVQSLGLSTFDRYVAAKRAQASARTALALSREHGLSTRSDRLSGVVDTTATATQALAIASGVLLVGYALIVALIGWLFARQVRAWAGVAAVTGLRRSVAPSEVQGL